MSATAPAVSVRDASKWYGDVVAVNEVSFDLRPGTTGLLGPNGAGKSTVLHMVAGMLRPSTGSVLVHGQPAWRRPEVYHRLGLVPEREAVHGHLTARQYALASARLRQLPDPREAADRAIAMVALDDAADRRMDGYSKGMRQRAKIAAALVHEPDVLVLDEPFNGTDPRQRAQLTQVLRDLGAAGRTILFSSHILEDVEDLADEVLVVVGGRLAASGDFREIRRLMTNRPHTFRLTTSDDRAVAARLVGRSHVVGLTFGAGHLEVRTRDFGAFTRSLPADLLAAGAELHELTPSDRSLETVFSYLVQP